jgi:hypothetical protein
MLQGYYLVANDNDSYIQEEFYKKEICECKDFVFNREKYLNEDIMITKKYLDCSYTYDGYFIVSKRFKLFYEKSNFMGLKFFKINKKYDLYYAKAFKSIEFDSKRRKTKFLEFNQECEMFNEIVGATPICLKSKKKVTNSFFKTDVLFGRGYSQSPFLIVDIEIGKKLKKEKFKGLQLKEILSKYEWENR